MSVAVHAAEEVEDDGEKGLSPGQDVHEVAPAASEYVDVGHDEQAKASVVSLCSPWGHCWQSTVTIVGSTSSGEQ